MRGGHGDIARAYILYRAERARLRQEKAEKIMPQKKRMVDGKGQTQLLDVHYLEELVKDACADLTATDPDSLLRQALGEMYNGISEHEMYKALYLSARARIEKEPNTRKSAPACCWPCCALKLSDAPSVAPK